MKPYRIEDNSILSVLCNFLIKIDLFYIKTRKNKLLQTSAHVK